MCFEFADFIPVFFAGSDSFSTAQQKAA